MAVVRVKHPGIGTDDAKKPPKREPLPEGDYEATIMAANPGATNGSPPVQKVSVEFQILHAIKEDGSIEFESCAKRRAFQDYVLEPDERYPDMNETRRWEVQQLVDATGIPFELENGLLAFDTDHLQGKIVRITIRHRKGRDIDEATGQPKIFTNVTKVDSAEDPAEGDIV